MNSLKKNLTLALLLSFSYFSTTIFGYQLLEGDKSAAEGQTFSFPVGPYAINKSGEYFFVAAHESNVKDSGNVKEFTLSRVGRNRDKLYPLVPKYAVVHGQSGQGNPLFDVGITFLSLLENRRDRAIDIYPVVVTSEDNTAVHVLDLANFRGALYKKNEDGICDELSSRISVITFDSIVNANDDAITAINAITTADPGSIFTAVDMGNPHGGIATLMLAYKKESSSNKTEKQLALDKAHDKELEDLEVKVKDEKNMQKIDEKETSNKSVDKHLLGDKNKEEEKKDTEPSESDKDSDKKEVPKKTVLDIVQLNSTAPLNITSDVVKIVGDLASIQVLDMYWDSVLECLFIALHVQSGVNVSDGAKALVLGKFENSTLVLKDIVPDTALTGQDKIIGGTGADVEFSLHKVRTMHTSNRLSYIITLGGQGDQESTKQNVSALPIVDDMRSTDSCCMLADKDSLPVDTFRGGCIRRIVSRKIEDAAQDGSDLLTENSPEAAVGGGSLGFDIADIFVVGDAVFAVVEPQQDNELGGLYMSRALFDKNGKIKNWTAWQHVSSTDAPLYGKVLDPAEGNFYFLTGNAQDNVKTVKRTVWASGDENGVQDLISAVNAEFSQERAGIQGLFEFPYKKQGAPVGLKNITMLVATGYNKVVLSEIAQEDTSYIGDFTTDKQVFTDGTLNGFSALDTRVIAVSGGAVNEIGPIESCTVTLQSSGRLWIGGVNGLAVLVDSSGDGWELAAGLGPKFVGLTADMAFKKVGNFMFVRKLFQEENFLYVLTDQKLYRVDITASDFVAGVLDIVEIVSLATIPGLLPYGTLLDFVASDKLGILATSVGLFRVGDGKDVQVDTELNWTEIEVPSYCGPIKQLLAVSTTLREQDIVKENTNGVLYVLSADAGKNVSQFNRFTVNYTVSENKNGALEINSQTILPFPDYFVQKQSVLTCSPSCACSTVCQSNGQTLGSSEQGLHSYFVHFGTFRELLEDEGALRFSSFDRDQCWSPSLKLLPPGHVFGKSFPIVGSRTVTLSIQDNSDIVKILRSVTGPMFVAGDFGLKVNE